MQVIQSQIDALHFNFGSDRAIYLQLAEKLELLIVDGTFGMGEKLPSVRELALYTKVNPNTLQKSLALLEEKRLIATDRTNGKFVTTDEELIETVREKLARETAKRFLTTMQGLGFPKHKTIKFLKTLEEENETF